MTMKTSRKGVRLNEACYFCYYPPHIRKKMSIMRIIPRHLISESRKKLDHSSENMTNSRKLGKIIFNQQSEEIAVITYNERLNSDSTIISNKIEKKSQEIQTDLIVNSQHSLHNEIKHEISSSHRKISLNNNKISHNRKLSSINKISSEEKISSHDKLYSRDKFSSKEMKISSQELESEISSNFHVNYNFLSLQENFSDHNKFIALSNNKNFNFQNDNNADDNEKKNSWWRNFFRQFIVDFFLQLLGKNTSRKSSNNMKEKFFTIGTSTSNYNNNNNNTNVDDDEEKNNGKGDRKKNSVKLISANNKKILNSFDDDDNNDARTNTRIMLGKEEKLFFDLIQLTQDENLRAIILEQAMRMRILEEENARFRKKLAEKLKTRQSSSPFY
ncbi:putative mediator of RNA polymerase II transcription subunit 24 [Leptopilina boulardi]|uniref:putative mediator of RNA polymerase II transcription subunit 24 n=1 Tax=Leptopilina boulardi TaxID=63433 RepID=UPI0021F59D6B|nr:putative mediator of RNA polymerase II transcription subunit 24 [Leptopilina boulardi]